MLVSTDDLLYQFQFIIYYRIPNYKNQLINAIGSQEAHRIYNGGINFLFSMILGILQLDFLTTKTQQLCLLTFI